MDTIEGKERMVFDWLKAVEIIKEREATAASAGLSGDLEWTGGAILEDGKPISKDDTYVYLASTWATPVLVIGDEEIPCFVMESKTEWHEGTYWPKEAREAL